VELAPPAQSDLQAAVRYIAASSPEAALGLVRAALGLIATLRQNPWLGARLPDREDELRAATVPGFRTYRLFYRYDEARDRLQVVRLLHGAREWPSLID
jgi:plasmid stabilization system protein ParE